MTLADTTELVREGARLHALSDSAIRVFGKALSVGAFLSACLKNEKGDISFAINGEGRLGTVQVAGNHALSVRGCVGEAGAEGTEEELLGKVGSLTVVRGDGYARPFVGSCDFPKTISIEDLFERYFLISEQLPTYLASVVKTNGAGRVAFAGVAALQPLPFTDEKTIADMPKGEALYAIVEKMQTLGVEKTVKEYFSAKSDGIERREATYKCNCSREYLSEVLVTLGEEELRKIVKEDGKIGAHCQFCNTDYVFTDEDLDVIFKKE